jgi:hypothetical protein
MSFDKIKSTDLVEANFVENIINELNKLKPELQALATSLKETLAASRPPQTADEYKALKKQIDDLNAATETYKNVTKEVSQAEKDQIKEKVRNQMESQKLRKEARLNIQASQDNKSAYEQLNATLEINRKKVKDLLASNKELTKADEALIRETQALDKRLKEIDKTVGQNNRNVGNYSDEIQKALGNTKIFAREQAALKAISEGLAPLFKMLGSDVSNAAKGFKDAKGGIQQMGMGLNFLKTALIATGIGAFVVLLGTAAAFFTKTQRGADMLSGAMAGLGMVVGKLIDGLSHFFETLQKAFESDGILGALETLKNAIRDNITSRLEAIPKLAIAVFNVVANSFKILGNRIKNIASGIPLLNDLFKIDKDELEKEYNDLTGEIEKGLENIANATLQLTTGVENGLDKLKELGKEVQKAYDLDLRLSAVNRQLKELEVSNAKLNQSLEATRELSRDETAALEARLKAIQEERIAIKKNEELKISLLSEKLTVQKAINKLNESMDADLEKTMAIEIELANAKKEASQMQISLYKAEKRIINEIKKLEEERLKFLKELEIERLNEAERATKIEILMVEERLSLLSDMEVEEREALNKKLKELKEKQVLDDLDIALSNEKLTAKEREILVLESQKKIRAIYQDTTKTQAIELKEQEDVIKKFVQTSQNAFNEVAKLFESQRKRYMEIMDERVNREQRLLESKKELAARGIEVDIAAQQEALAKLEAERERAEIKRRRRERQTAIMQTFLKLIETERPELALGKAIALVSGIQGFYDGTDELGKNDGAKIKSGGKDPLLIKAHPGEMILNPKESNFVRNTVGNRKDLINFIKQNHSNTSTTNQTITSVQEIKLKADVDSFGSVIISLSDKSSGTHTHTRFPKNTRI